MSTALIDELLDPLTLCLDAESAKRIADFQIAPSLQDRLNLLAERANEGVLTNNERIDYEALINVSDFVSIIKLKAQRLLKSNVRP